MSIKNAFSRLGITGRKVQRGEIYLIADDLIVLPETRLPSKPGRELHENRPVLILQTNLDNDDPLYLTILAAPLSHRVDLQGEALGKVDDITMNDIDAVLAANLGLIERPR